MDFSEYNRPLNENDLDEMRSVDFVAPVSSARSTGTTESPTVWKSGTSFTSAAMPACRVRAEEEFYNRGLPEGERALPRRKAAGSESRSKRSGRRRRTGLLGREVLLLESE